MKHFVSNYHKHNYMTKSKFSFLVLLLALIIHTGALHSQSLQTISTIGLGTNGLDFSIEIPVAEKFTIEPAIGLGPSYDFSDRDGVFPKLGKHWALSKPSVHVSANSKFFYDRARRLRKDKSLLFNSGSFIGVKVEYVSKPLTSDKFHGQTNTLLTMLSLGGQRNIGRYWRYSFYWGLGYGRNLEYSYGTFYPAYDFKVAYVLPLFSKK